MTTFVQWLHAQEKREDDPVGWFARYWRDLPQRPRLSSPASIARHLEDRGLFVENAPHLQQAYDATLKEYRHVRDQTVQEAISAAQPLPGMPEPDAESLPSSPGQWVEHAAQAGMAAAAQAARPATQLDRIETLLAVVSRKLEGIERVLGLASDEDGAVLPAELPWGDLYAVADMTAEAD